MGDSEPSKAERLTFEIANKKPLAGMFNDKPLNIRRIRLNDLRKAWDDIIAIIKLYQLQLIKMRERGDIDEEGRADVATYFDGVKELGPNAIEIIKTFIKTSSDANDEILEEADLMALLELLIVILEFNIGPELRNFTQRGESILMLLGFMREQPTTKLNVDSSKLDTEEMTSMTSSSEN